MGTETTKNDDWLSRQKSTDEWVADALAGVNNFAADMREKRIHVGLGSPPRCVICGVWPCDGWWMDHMGEWHQGQPPGTQTNDS